MSHQKLTGDALEIYRRHKAMELRNQGMCIADIAAALYPARDKSSINRVHALLANAPRRLRFRGPEMVERDGRFAHAVVSRKERP